MKNSLKLFIPVSLLIIPPALLITLFSTSSGRSAYLSLGILIGIALLGILIGEFLYVINRRLRGG